jgi:hypothetical protein
MSGNAVVIQLVRLFVGAKLYFERKGIRKRSSPSRDAAEAIRQNLASVMALIGILNFIFSPSTLVGVAPVQALTSIESTTGGAIQLYSKAELKQIVRF